MYLRKVAAEDDCPGAENEFFSIDILKNLMDITKAMCERKAKKRMMLRFHNFILGEMYLFSCMAEQEI